MDKDKSEDLAFGCLVCIIILFTLALVRWLFVVGVVWFICFCLNFLDASTIQFNLGFATATWLILELIGFFVRGNK